MFSSLTRNAVSTMLWVLKNQDTGPVTTDSISKRLGLSISYLESLLSKLKKMGFLVSYRGPGGGYCSNGKASELLLIDLVKTFDFSKPGETLACAAAPAAIDKDLINWLMQDFMQHHLMSMNFADIMDTVDEDAWGAEPVKPTNTPEMKKFKPLQIHKLPSGPNSVFNLAASLSI